jgi:hypothetical protein
MMRTCRVLLALGMLSCAQAATAQEVTRDTTRQPPAEQDLRTRVPCLGQKISDIIIVTQPPFTERLPRTLEFVRAGARAVHANTRDGVVRRYLLLDIGDPCDELRRAESERILRAQPFLVDARITTFDDGEGGVRLEVETRDEFTLILSPNVQLSSPMIRGLRVGESNIAGAGIDGSLLWRDGGAFDDAVGLRMVHYQLAGRRNELRLEGVRYEHGNDYAIDLMRPYYTDLQRIAWRASMGGTTHYAEFVRPELERNALLVDRRYVTLGAIARVGSERRLRLVGLSFSREHQRTDDEPWILTDSSLTRDTLGPVPGEFRRQDVSRVNVLVGMRRLRFARVQGFDALTGAQDVRIGFQLGMLAGRSVQLFGGQDNDRFLATDLYAGYGGQRSFVGMQMAAEGRRDASNSAWENVLTSGRVAWYLRPSVRQLTMTQLHWGTGNNMGIPFQLTFNDRQGGLLGYRNSREPGGQRLVLRAEQRMVLPSVRNVSDFGVAAFADAGRLWRGGAPYGVTTPWRASTGVSLQAALPPRSRRLWRLDFGFPVGSDPDAKFEVRFSSIDRSRTFWRQPMDLQRASERTAPASIFSWP